MGPATDKHQAPTHRLKLYVRAVIESEANDKRQSGTPSSETMGYAPTPPVHRKINNDSETVQIPTLTHNQLSVDFD